MAGVIMLLAVSFTGGYLFIEWLDIGMPFYAHVFIMGLIMAPVEFLAAAMAFFSGLSANWLLLKLFLERRGFKKGEAINAVPAISGMFGLFIVFAVLFALSPIHTVIFFGASLVYGIISIYV
ncbi:hypothetical protein DRW41_12325 [Neobacillus piezotolerans]|uniref:Uncharacterized protein n=1 Tax=Neobacillus piezotolerans TaxID=2259171 RepID=A0A3D8GPA1_9BACI|nr:hypothetical protein [Neobacillus piezotolerans]RDU36320.1 hypothetical protein DRW41_12325 [Neobacillus piezotolerans]